MFGFFSKKKPATAPQDPPPVLVNGPYSYAMGPNTLGIGSNNMALERGPIPVDMPIYGSRYNVRKSFEPLRGAMPTTEIIYLPTVDIKADGVYLSGALQLQGLTNGANKTANG